MLFGLFSSVEKKTRTAAKQWLEIAVRVYHYQRDRLSEAELGSLSKATELLRQRMKEKADTGKLKLAIEDLESVLKGIGGLHYPKSTLVEWVEFFLVAAIVILGIRAYFVQPFKIPTNSMWPSYNGLTPEVFRTKAEEPNVAEKGLRFLTNLATQHRVDAPADGEILIPISSSTLSPVSKDVPGRSWIIFPEVHRQYYLLVGNRWVSDKVPSDFDFGWVLRDTFFPGKESFNDVLTRKLSARDFVERDVTLPDGGGMRRVQFLKTGKVVRRGDRVLSYDILTGDNLFVDRMSYHFVKPEVGDGFVFRTGSIHVNGDPDYLRRIGAGDGKSLDQYYIKRLAGVPGDKLEIREPVLLRNGKPITGAKAFEKNANLEGNFGGYVNGQRSGRYPDAILLEGETLTVPEDSFVALGDNSHNSLDSRYWGFVPAKDVVGRPLFIYYPFTKRWGVAP